MNHKIIAIFRLQNRTLNYKTGVLEYKRDSRLAIYPLPAGVELIVLLFLSVVHYLI